MINFIRERFGELLIGLLFILLLTSIAGTLYFREKKVIDGVVLEHGIVSDRNGDRTYVTIIQTEDGFIEEKEGLKLYVVPINKHIKVEVYRWKKIKF
jgi:hypothetical protein